MSLEPEKDHAHQPGDDSPTGDTPNASDNAQLEDAELQERYRKEYFAQLRRLSCPGCGEDFTAF